MSKTSVKEQMRDNYIRYASYVILDRAIPHVADGLKPVQRRILHTMRNIHDGKLHKVANIAGQTMAFHPHGDAAITDALVNLSNKGFLIDQQGNFGNLYTGDSAAAARYIEARLSPLAIEAVFNPDLTEETPSYDGRANEPVVLPAKIPILLMQGAEGIAVGMSTKILPHNFRELLEAQIAIIEGDDFTILPDFPTGGIMDASEYKEGKGKVKLRAKLRVADEKTIVIDEICHGTNTESLIRSIDEAAKRGKIKIDGISDFTAEKVEIEIKLPRGKYAKDLVEALYAYTDCEVSINSLPTVIKDDRPWDTTVNEILRHQTGLLTHYLKRELEIEQERLLEKIFQKTLDQIFIDNKVYKQIETCTSYEKVHEAVEKGLKPFHEELLRIPTKEDRERLLGIAIRRISKFDLGKNQDEIQTMEDRLLQIAKDLKGIKRFAIKYINGLLKKYGSNFPRRTRIKQIKQLDRKKIATISASVGFDPSTGYIGTKVKGELSFQCTNFDKLLLMYQNGTYRVINIPEKEYVQSDKNRIVYAGIADKETVLRVVYKDSKTNQCFGKRFIIKSFIMDREYRFFDQGSKLEYISTKPDAVLELAFKPKPKQKSKSAIVQIDDIIVKGVSAKGIRLSPKEVRKVKQVKNGKPFKDTLF
jgi:topoisomerase-4 subunit A